MSIGEISIKPFCLNANKFLVKNLGQAGFPDKNVRIHLSKSPNKKRQTEFNHPDLSSSLQSTVNSCKNRGKQFRVVNN